MELEILTKSGVNNTNSLPNGVFRVKSTPELLTYILLNQEKCLDGYKIVMISNEEEDVMEFNLKEPIILLESEIQNIKNQSFNNKMNTLIKE